MQQPTPLRSLLTRPDDQQEHNCFLYVQIRASGKLCTNGLKEMSAFEMSNEGNIYALGRACSGT